MASGDGRAPFSDQRHRAATATGRRPGATAVTVAGTVQHRTMSSIGEVLRGRAWLVRNRTRHRLPAASTEDCAIAVSTKGRGGGGGGLRDKGGGMIIKRNVVCYKVEGRGPFYKVTR